jgi:DNA-binding transcriptional LysR family regulator
VNQEVLMPNKLFLVAPKVFHLPDHKGANAGSFSDVPIIFREKGSGTRLVLEQYMNKIHVHPKVKLELTSAEAVKQAVIAGLGMSVLSIFSIHLELMNKALKIVPFKGFPLVNQWRLVWNKDKKLSPVAQAYLAFIKKEKAAIVEKKFSWMHNF